jgi:hypothetical protein
MDLILAVQRRMDDWEGLLVISGGVRRRHDPTRQQELRGGSGCCGRTLQGEESVRTSSTGATHHWQARHRIGMSQELTQRRDSDEGEN